MSLKISSVKKISNSDNKIIFEFPSDTLFDSIPIDLWETIIKYYYHYKPFAIGNNKSYSGYRVIKTKEYKTENFKKLFLENYQNNKGIYALDEIENNDNY